MEKFLIFSFLLVFELTAFASAWNLPAGKNEFISSYEYKTITTYFTDPISKQKSIYGVYSFDYYNFYYQRGMNEDYNIGFDTKWYNYRGIKSATNENIDQNADDSLLLKNAPSEDFIFFQENQNYLSSYYSNTENKPLDTKFFIQKTIVNKDNYVFSIQPGIKFIGNSWDKALELRLLYGHSFNIFARNGFLNFESGVNRSTYKFITNSDNNITFFLESSLGFEIRDNYTLIAKNYYKYNGENNLEESIGQLSMTYKYNDYISWQNGYSTNLNKRDEYLIESYISGIWIKF